MTLPDYKQLVGGWERRCVETNLTGVESLRKLIQGGCEVVVNLSLHHKPMNEETKLTLLLDVVGVTTSQSTLATSGRKRLQM